MYKRTEFQTIKSRLEERRKFIQIVMGPRQVGKSTVVKQVLGEIDTPYQFFSADNVPATNTGSEVSVPEPANEKVAELISKLASITHVKLKKNIWEYNPKSVKESFIAETNTLF